ncbi:phosphodiester glycosidase family protein, partial [Georgenia sp. 10Sc9-8]|nr:phosphodiester glycosidase family protein [Georgenia halotolerans]
MDSAGFMRGDVLTAELSIEGLSVDYVDAGDVTSARALEEQLEDVGAVAGVNGDFFDINNSNSSLGVGLSRDGLVKGPNPGRHRAVGIDTEGLAQLTRMYLEGRIVMPGGRTAPLSGYNQNSLATGQIGAYTTLWGDYSRDRATMGVTRKREVLVTDGVVTSVSDEPGAGVLAENTIALVGRESGAETLAALTVGDEVDVTYGIRGESGEMEVAIGGNQELVRDGAVVEHSDETVHPRTAVGFTEDRSTMFLVTIDGRMADSRGMSLEELGAFMVELGAHTALNLDGGGSSTMAARDPGETGVELENEPSDGYQRSVPNGLALFAAEGSGRVTGMRVVTEDDDQDEDLLRVFPGLTRDIEAFAHDETYAPVEAEPRYRATPAAVGKIDRAGTFTARRSGDVTITASSRSATGEIDLVVLGDLTRMRATRESISLAGVEDAGSFGLVGFDGDGFQAPIDPADVELEYDPSLISVEPDQAGGFIVRPLVDSTGTVITATVGGVVAHVAVSVGLESRVVADFADASDWSWSGARSTGSLEPTTGRDGGTALQIN